MSKLFLSFNQIIEIENLENLINLSYLNRIIEMKGLGSLINLQTLDLAV